MSVAQTMNAIIVEISKLTVATIENTRCVRHQEKLLHRISGQLEQLENKNDEQIRKVDRLGELTAQNTQVLGAILKGVNELQITQGIQSDKLDTLDLEVKQILKELTIPPAVSFIVTISAGTLTANTKEIEMSKRVGASADISVSETGQATLTITFQDADGVAVPPPAGLAAPTVVPSDAAADGTGSSFTVGTPTPTTNGFTYSLPVVQPPPQPLHTGVTFACTVPSGLAGQTAPITVTSDPPLDVVPGPASTFVAAASNS